MLRFLIIGSLLFTNLQAGIEKHFKPAKDKTEVSKMANVDFIYMINLDKRPERYERTMNALRPYDIYPYRFSAVNGWELSFDAIDELGIVYESWMPPGPIASVFRHAKGKEHI